MNSLKLANIQLNVTSPNTNIKTIWKHYLWTLNRALINWLPNSNWPTFHSLLSGKNEHTWNFIIWHKVIVYWWPYSNWPIFCWIKGMLIKHNSASSIKVHFKPRPKEKLKTHKWLHNMILTDCVLMSSRLTQIDWPIYLIE